MFLHFVSILLFIVKQLQIFHTLPFVEAKIHLGAIHEGVHLVLYLYIFHNHGTRQSNQTCEQIEIQLG